MNYWKTRIVKKIISIRNNYVSMKILTFYLANKKINKLHFLINFFTKKKKEI